MPAMINTTDAAAVRANGRAEKPARAQRKAPESATKGPPKTAAKKLASRFTARNQLRTVEFIRTPHSLFFAGGPCFEGIRSEEIFSSILRKRCSKLSRSCVALCICVVAR